MNYQILSPAQRELKQAAFYYESKQEGLGKKFFIELESTILRIIDNPKGWTQISEKTRRCLLQGFPYGIIYQVGPEKILIVSIMHLRKHPDSWKKNL